MKKNKLIFTVLTVLVLFLSCKNNLVAKLESGHSAPVDVKAINVYNTSTISLVKADTKQLRVKVLPVNASDKKLTFSSSADNIASVDEAGVITGKEVGNAVITVKAANGVQRTVNVTVTPEPVPVTGIIFEEAVPASLFIGETYTIKAKAHPDDATNKELTYSNDNDKVFVSSDGTVTAQSEGVVTISIKSQSKPEITKTVTITVKQSPSIGLTIKEVTSGSGESELTFTIKTLHGKLSYTPKIVGEESDWLRFDRKDNTTSEEEDTIYLKAAQNKTVWKRIAYINFKNESNQEIKNADGEKLEVKVIQEENKNPAVTIEWVDGIGEPTDTEKEKIPVYGGEKKVYWDDNKIFWWNESTTTKWFNNRKVSLLGISAPEGADGNQCWAKTASNLLQWWFVQNKENIDRYIQHKSQAEKAQYVHYYKRELPTEKEKEKSNIANAFRLKAHNGKLGDYIISGLAWYLYGNANISRKDKPAFEGPALFKDIFNKENTPIKRETVYDKTSFNEIISKALKSKKAIGIDIWGSKGKNDYAHAITLWGAAFDEEENIIAIYVVDNNFKENRIFPYGIYYKEGKPYLFNYGVNNFVQDRYVGQVTTLDVGQDLFDKWFAENP